MKRRMISILLVLCMITSIIVGVPRTAEAATDYSLLYVNDDSTWIRGGMILADQMAIYTDYDVDGSVPTVKIV